MVLKKKLLVDCIFSQLGVMTSCVFLTGFWVVGLYVLKGIFCDGNTFVLFLSVRICYLLFLLTLV